MIEPTALILVAVLPQPRDLEIARMLGWYRIPLRSAPRVIAVDYLAFYQTAAFGASRWRIEYVAAVQGYELTTRQELLKDEPDHPHARHEYYKLQLGPLQKLPHPILSESWRRITFFYTTGEYFLKATEIKDLIVAEDERPLLWRALRDRQAAEPVYHTESPATSLDPALLIELLGLSAVIAGSDKAQEPPSSERRPDDR